MDDKIRKCCPNCCQLYYLKHQSSGLKGNLPLFLTCGHTICENCVKTLTKFQEPIECKVCLRSMDIKAEDVLALAQNKAHMYDMFPVNHQLLGELTQQLMQNHHGQSDSLLEDCFIDLQAILNQQETTKDKCQECHNLTAKMCQQCDIALCENCFNKIHKNFVIFKNHVLQKIAKTPDTDNNCKTHTDKPLNYYCKDCLKSICMDCLFVGSDKSCKEHNLMCTSEINDSHMEQILNILPKVDETFRRLSKTAVDIGQLLYNIENENGTKCEATQIIADIEHHFSKLCSIVQKHKRETIEIVTNVKYADKESLKKAKEDVCNAMKKTKNIMNMINAAADTTMYKQMNLSALLEDASKAVETPWYLMKEEDKDNPLKVTVNENLNELISDYIHLEGNASSMYKLLSRAELGEDVEIPPPPPVPVMPPQMPRDVRQLKKPKEPHAPSKTRQENPRQAPNYRSKSASVNSLNSCSSDSSKRSYNQNDGYHSVPQVRPYMDSQEPQQLVEGSQELIYVSHIVDPHNFFVQRATDQKLVKELLREFRDVVSRPKPLPCNVNEGKVYLAFNKADNLWQRCRVISVDKKDSNYPKYLVYCFDFGSYETVSINNLRMLPPARWSTPPPLALNCAIANCEPVNGSWMSDDSILIQNIIDNKQAVINIRRVVVTPTCDIKYECDVTTFEDKVSLAHALVFHRRAKMPNPRLKYSTINNLREKPKISTSSYDFGPQTVDEIYFTFIVSPDKFFVRKLVHQTDYLKLNEELNHEYSLSSDTGKIYLPELGMACVVNTEKCRSDGGVGVEEEGAWARGVVAEWGTRGRVRVQLVDSGAHAFVHWTQLRHIHHKFTTFRALATECHLAGVTPLKKSWSPASVALLRKYQNQVLEMHVEDSRNRGSIGVTLFDKSDDENTVCINNEMIKYKFAISFGIFNYNWKHDLKDQKYTYKTPLDKQKKPKPKSDQITILRKEDSPKKVVTEDELAAKDKGPLRLEAKVLQYISPSLIYVSLVHQQKSFSEMFENIQKHYSNDEIKGKDGWLEGEKCCTICLESQTWRRATILELDETKAKVFYSDFATVETVPTASLRELAPEFLATGVAAIKCHLCGIMPAIGAEWPSLTKEFLKELLDAYRRLFITKVGNFKNKSMPIEIWVYHTIPGGALDPDRSEWRCLNKKIIEQGLAIPIKSEPLDDDIAENKDESPAEETLSFLNVTGSVHEWLQLEPMPTLPLPRPEPDCGSDSSTVVEHDDPGEGRSVDSKPSDKIFVSEWLPPEPLQAKEFTAIATFVDNDGVVFLHDIAKKDTLDLIRNALYVRYKDPDPKAKYVKWTVGEPCIALYQFDGSFYRGRVVEVNEETSACLVHYIDYGNEEICSFTDMRKSIALHEISTQAHKCVLNRIKPVGKQWERQTLDYIHKLIVEKHCYVIVTGDSIDGITPIDMKYDKLWINDHLVDFELAAFTDGSKPAVRRFVPPPATHHHAPQPQVDLHSDSDPDPDLDLDLDRDPDSGPDYIVEQDNTDDSIEMHNLKGKDWNVIIAEDEDGLTGKYIEFPKISDDVFKCKLTLINDLKILPLTIVHDDETMPVYEEMFREIQMESDNMPPLNGIFKNKACIALFEEDNRWYRAVILEYSEVRNCIKVRYVDYGNIEIISLTDAREIHDEWVKLPPLTLPAKLHDIDVNPSLEVKLVLKEYSELFADKGPFDAKIINDDDLIPSVELRNSNGELVYENLIENGVFIKCSPKD